MIENLFVKGWGSCIDNTLDLDDIANEIGTKYLGMFPGWELIECTENFKVEESDRIVEWHNDSNYGMNITFLYYLDEMSPETGGSISIRNNISGEEEQIYPKAYQLLVMSQKPHIEHRAEFCSVRRHMFNIDFAVKGF